MSVFRWYFHKSLVSSSELSSADVTSGQSATEGTFGIAVWMLRDHPDHVIVVQHSTQINEIGALCRSSLRSGLFGADALIQDGDVGKVCVKFF